MESPLLLTQIQYDLLKELIDGQPCRCQPSATRQELIVRGYISAAGSRVVYEDEERIEYEPEFWRITLAGQNALKTFDQHVKEKAEHKRSKRNDRIFQLALALLSFLLGLLTEHFAGITDAFSAFFASLG